MGAYDPEKEIRQPLLHKKAPSIIPSQPKLRRKPTISTAAFALVLLAAVLAFSCSLTLLFNISLLVKKSPSKNLEEDAWKFLKHHVSLLDVPRIGHDEFLQRQSIIATELDKAGVDAFIAEPSASSSYYANISSAFELSERPFLVIIDRKGAFSYLAPKFELGRIAGLSMVYSKKTVIEWKEEESPYEVLKRETSSKKVMLDEHVRYMIAAGIQGTGIEVVPMTQTIQSLRAVKTEAELAILRGINTFTLELIRSLQQTIKIGMKQETVFTAASNLFSRAGVGKGYWAIILFGEQAASPHGGSSGHTLRDGEFVLIDIGSELHDYGSDVTRTILPSKSIVSDELMGIWKTVHMSQSAAVAMMRANETCKDIDAASRNVIIDKGYGDFYTHRLGHGLGLEMHEHPYLNGANREKLKIGEVVTNEPGIYVTGEQAKVLGKSSGFGVRLEDPIHVTADGGVPMTGSRAKSPYEP
ncbi:probable Putative mitochodrial aminopeptidase II [Rhynchosporium agropyri]|uniref:Probable Xaa-Pro aminopeptidase P n=1 Tax=Rhynchosporium agropyri TaxID=914238 RepID=A0A1E1KTN4_9HELO|nr:probable Putative mitochodrial aminopeptidase II [Rhynchosporium agropyri]